MLSEAAWQHLTSCHVAHAEKQYFAAAVWGAVFLEAFLGDLSNDLALPRPAQDDLNGRVQQLQQYCKNHSPAQPGVPDEIVKRCHDNRSTRNRLVHFTGLAKKTLEADAASILGAIQVILDWYRTIRPESIPTQTKVDVEPSTGIRVFLSTITPHSARQKYFLEMFCSRLKSLGLNPIIHSATIYDRQDPIGAVREKIKSCHAAIVVGLERSHAYFLRDKEGAEAEREETHRKYTSGWLHLEAGLANALGLDVFVLCQHDICNDGVFDRQWNSYAIAELSTLEDDSPELNAFLGHLAQWAQRKTESNRTIH